MCQSCVLVQLVLSPQGVSSLQETLRHGEGLTSAVELDFPPPADSVSSRCNA